MNRVKNVLLYLQRSEGLIVTRQEGFTERQTTGQQVYDLSIATSGPGIGGEKDQTYTDYLSMPGNGLGPG